MEAKRILDGLQKQRERGFLCDVNLEAEGELFPVHKAVLAASSSYFEAMFAGSFKESTDDTIHLNSVCGLGLSVILDVIYSSRLELTVPNVTFVLQTAHLFQMSDVVEQCGNFMAGNLDLINCLEFLKLAEKYDLEKCTTAADRYLLNNFVDVSARPGFLDLSQESICRYLSDDELMINGQELEVFKCAKRWLEAEPNRSEETLAVMQNVRFPRLSVDTLMDKVLKDPIIDSNTGCRNLVLEALRYHTNTYTQPLQNGYQYKPRGELGLLLISPGRRNDTSLWTVDNQQTELWMSTFPDMQSQRRSHIDTPFVLESLCCGQYGNFLFLFAVDSRSLSTVSWRYDASSNQWISITSVPREAAVGCAAAVLDKEILLFGGMTITKKSRYKIITSADLAKCTFVYSIQDNKWRQLADLPERLAYMGATSLGSVVYSAGGVIPKAPDECESSHGLSWYDVGSNAWKRLTPMWNGRSHFCLEAHCNTLYAIGGIQVKTKTSASFPISLVETYDVTQNQWTVIFGVEVLSAAAATSHVIDKKIFILGGERPAVDGFSSKKSSYFDTETNKMETPQQYELPKLSSRHASGILIFPKVKLS